MFKVRKFAGVLGLVALSLSGCQDALVAENPSTLTAAEREIRDVQRQRRNTAKAIGSIVGAATAVAILRHVTEERCKQTRRRGGQCSTRPSQQEEILAGLAGAAAGRAFGKVTGDYVNRRAESTAATQQDIRSLIAATDRDIANYRALNSTSARLIAQQRQKVRSLNARLSSGAVSVEGYRSQIASARNNVGAIDAGIKDIEAQIRFMKKDVNDLARAGKSTGALSSRIASLESQKRTLESRRRALASVYDEVPDSVGAYDF